MSIINEKNITARQLALWCAFVISTMVTILLLISSVTNIFLFVSIIIVFGTSFFTFYYTIERFFYRKIKLLYKFISQTKAGVKEEALRDIVMPQTTIDQVSDDVMKWANEQKKEIEILEKNELFRREFLMNFAHEIKTPIFTVQGYLHTLSDGAINDIAVRDKFINNAIKGIDRLGLLVNNIDQIAKLESGVFVMQKEKFVIQELVMDVIHEFQLEADKNKVNLAIKAGCESDVTVFADKQKIKQVLVNLINNAIKYSKEKGHITAGIYIVDNENVYIEITDDGDGIAEEHVPRVFERFYRTDSGRSRNAGGSGLGLAIVKHIIEAHGHTVTCRSSLHIGSSFGFTLSR
jgi:two-component system, OmpR family, phosphate regulon sensor histidine kinase PhoR